MSVCKGCGKEIVWITMASGKAMPCDTKKVTIVTEDGNTFSGYIPHWATCPKYKDFKKGDKK